MSGFVAAWRVWAGLPVCLAGREHVRVHFAYGLWTAAMSLVPGPLGLAICTFAIACEFERIIVTLSGMQSGRPSRARN